MRFSGFWWILGDVIFEIWTYMKIIHELLCVILLLELLKLMANFHSICSQWTWNQIAMCWCVARWNRQGGPAIPGTVGINGFQWFSPPRLYPAKTNYANPNFKSKIIQPSPLLQFFNHSFLSQFPSFLPPECINASTASSSSNGSFTSDGEDRGRGARSSGVRGSGSKPLCMLRCDASGCWYHL